MGTVLRQTYRMASLVSSKAASCAQKAPRGIASRGVRPAAVRKATVCRVTKEQRHVFPAAVFTSLTATLPAAAIVDDRLNGDGTGLPLGINDGALGIVLATIPLAIFSLYFFAGQQDSQIISGGKDDDSGLSL